MPTASVHDKLSGRTAPTLDQVYAIVAGCKAHAVSVGIGVESLDVSRESWRSAWITMQQAQLEPRRGRLAAGRAENALARDPSAELPGSGPQPDRNLFLQEIVFEENKRAGT